MKISEFDYTLPPELIAQHPLPQRDSSRLMVLEKNTGKITHKFFRDIVEFLNPTDHLILNNTKVFPARVKGEMADGKNIEMLLIKELKENHWEVLIKKIKKIKPGTKINLGKGKLMAELIDKTSEGYGIITFSSPEKLMNILAEIGETPLPPYIERKSSLPEDKETYQTVYATHQGAIAAPTAGLHFTNPLLNKIKSKGTDVAYITLHVGYGTFRPVRAEAFTEHRMDKEYYRIDPEIANKLTGAGKEKKRIVAVGTTTTRALESAFQTFEHPQLEGETDIFIYPGYKFKIINLFLTNFHLPRSTPLFLAAAFAGKDLLREAYRQAIIEKYRFYSYGDAMLII